MTPLPVKLVFNLLPRRMSVVEKEDWKSFIDLVSNAKLVVSSVQDVAWKLADYAKFRSNKEFIGKHHRDFVFGERELISSYHF